MNLGTEFRLAGVEGWLHAVDLDSGAEVGHDPDTPVVTASIFKVPLLVELARQADEGSLDWTEQVTVGQADRVFGPTGISAFLDEVTLSWRDLALMMIALSDNTAADVLLERVGRQAVNAMLDGFGLSGTRVVTGAGGLFRSTIEDVGRAWPVVDPEEVARLRVLDPAQSNRSTPRECTSLMSLIWTDRAASPDRCAWMRTVLGRQVWPHRLSSGFPYDDVGVSGKTGTLPTVRNEIGVVEYPDGGRYAVAVFTRSYSTAVNQPRADAVIGTAARMAVDHLRG